MMYWKKSISDIVAAFVVQMLFFVPAYAGKVESGITVDRGGDFTLNSADGPLSLNELRGTPVGTSAR